jgi:hypothetical protein
VVRRRKHPLDSDLVVGSMLVKKGIPLLSLIAAIISGKECGFPR